MNERDEHAERHLTPEQSADVLKYYDEFYNGEARRRGWKDKVSLGRIAAKTLIGRESILPDGKPMLTPDEASDGIDFIQTPPKKPDYDEPSKSDEYYDKLDELADKLGSYDIARHHLDADGWK